MLLEFFSTFGFLYFLSVFIYRRTFLKKIHIQPSVMCGLIYLFLGPQIFSFLNVLHYEFLKELPKIMISFLFAGIFLNQPKLELEKSNFISILRQGIFVWIIGLGQLLVGFLLALILYSNASKEKIIASIIEISWLGGFGSASAFSVIAKDLNLSWIGDLSLIMATTGILWGSISGILLVNLERYKNQNPNLYQEIQNFVYKKEEVKQEYLFYGFLFPLIPVFFAYYLKEFLIFVFRFFSFSYIQFLQNLPLFFIVIVVSFFMKIFILNSLNFKEDLGMQKGTQMFTDLVLEILIISSIASINIKVMYDFLNILIIFNICAILLNLLFYFFSGFFINEYPELSLINYGMATGTTATGMMLLQAYSKNQIPFYPVMIYGMAAPLSSPFIGGGIISLLIPYFVYNGHFYYIFWILLVILVFLIFINLYLKSFLK